MVPLVPALALLMSASAQDGLPAPQSCLAMAMSPDGRPLVSVEIEGYGRAHFIFDTGASHTAVGRPILDQLAVEDPVDQSVTTLTEHFDTQTVPVRLAVGSLGTRAVEAVVVEVALDEDLFALGLLGADYFGDERVRLDFEDGLLCIQEAAPAHVDGGAHHESRVPILEGSASRMDSFNVLIDTGATRTLMNTELASAARRADRSDVRLNLHGVGSRIGRADQLAYLRRVEIGGLCAAGLRAPAADLFVFEALGWNQEPSIVLGMDTLRHTTIVIDYATGEFQLDGHGELRCERSRTGS